MSAREGQSDERDRPWLMRTYSGHSSARASNELYRSNLAKGQTGLSVAFDLPTQTGYDADHVLARGEVGKVGVPICSLEDMTQLFDGIPLDEMNTSMTINATAAWLLALYIAVAENQGADRAALKGTTQNDIIKEYLSRGTYVFGPAESLRLTGDVITFTVREVPKWNPINICSYHLQEVGATPVQEVAFAMATATAVLDEIKRRPEVDDETFGQVFGRISFFVNAGIRFIDEIAKLRAMGHLWDELGRERYGVENPRYRRFRYGVQVNSLGLTEAQPENNITRIVLEMLAVTLSKDVRARAVQLPAWNEALGLPRPWDQQLALRMQQILAYETDLLEHGDIFEGSHVMEARTAEIADAARTEYARVIDMGGSVEAVEYMKAELVRANAERMRRIESGEQTVVGVNAYVETEPSPLMDADGGVMKVDPASEAEQIERVEAVRAGRDQAGVDAALADLRRAVADGENVMPASIAAAKAGATTGEWTDALREEWGTYRGPTGVTAAGSQSPSGDQAAALQAARDAVRSAEERVGGKVRLLVGKPGLDGHSSGAEQIAVRARDAGFEVIYEGIRLTPAQIVRAAVDEDVHLIGLSILSGSHGELIPEVLEGLTAEDAADIPVVVGGIIPAEDAADLTRAGVAAVYTPKDFEVSRLVAEMADLVGRNADPVDRNADVPGVTGR